MNQDTRSANFILNGGIDVPAEAKEVLAHSGSVAGYKLPDGRTVRMVMALEVESPDGSSHQYLTAESDMAALGFGNLDYGDTSFEERDQQSVAHGAASPKG